MLFLKPGLVGYPTPLDGVARDRGQAWDLFPLGSKKDPKVTQIILGNRH